MAIEFDLEKEREHLAAFEALIEEHITLLGCTNDTARAAQIALCAHSTAPVQGEVVDAVAYMNTATGEVAKYGPSVMDWDDEQEPVEPLMTVAQHNRIMAAAKPDAELVELLKEARKHVSARAVGPTETGYLLQRIDAKLAELAAGSGWQWQVRQPNRVPQGCPHAGGYVVSSGGQLYEWVDE